MESRPEQTTQIQVLVDRLRSGDASAREELIHCAWDRLLRLTRKISRDFPGVRRWEQTEDVMQNASVRLWKALEKVRINDARHFLRLAAEKIRFELIDLARHYYGPMGQAAHHATQNRDPDQTRQDPPVDRAAVTVDPSRMAQWGDIHEQIGHLPEADREIFDLLWYHELSQEEAAAILGVDVRTVKRRWRRAKLNLRGCLKSDPDDPETA